MNLGAVGSAARQQYYDTSAAVAKNSVDPNKLIQESMKARSMQKKAAMDAESAVRQTKENIRGEMAIVQRDIDIDKTRMDLKKNLRKLLCKCQPFIFYKWSFTQAHRKEPLSKK